MNECAKDDIRSSHFVYFHFALKLDFIWDNCKKAYQAQIYGNQYWSLVLSFLRLLLFEPRDLTILFWRRMLPHDILQDFDGSLSIHSMFFQSIPYFPLYMLLLYQMLKKLSWIHDIFSTKICQWKCGSIPELWCSQQFVKHHSLIYFLKLRNFLLLVPGGRKWLSQISFWKRAKKI